ncbi:acyltransferase domain-containing protein [Janthinobacterium fluminis]|uniref:Acyltransferase domain-containing protein n=1 Tax=Janthinobacterium fluminis TaxID=2987524 RepID=A0ABT5K0C4_9BURK|nr:acyltransferase domain-containing protein [Janthinobacterium fluminis]MDC8758417.1 acyltransferase domain-containing protein [Janthinobacterium fluminis]
MKRQTAFLFSGQGSQYYQMGRGLYEQNPTFRSCMDRLDRVAHALLGTSVLQALYGPQGKAEPFAELRLTHPAIFMLEFALARSVIELGVEPDCTVGASLGTFAALAVAGCLPAEEALELVIRQALAIEAHAGKGGIIAVLAEPRLYEDSDFLQARAEVAGRNFAAHFLLAAPGDNLPAIESFLARAGVTHQLLPVQYPFHARWIEPIRDVVIAASGTGRLRATATPVICCASAGIVKEFPEHYFWQVARDEIGFMRTIAQMEQSGPFDYLDLGPSGTLATFLKYLLPKQSASRSFAAMTPYGRDGELLAAAVANVRAAGVPAAMET